jgi:UDP-glucose 4-epimerase
MKNNNCLVLGGGGFIGSHLCDTLLKEGYNVRIFDRIGFDKRNISHLIKKIEVLEGDFNNSINIKNSLKNIDYIFHLISSTTPSISMENPFFDVETNLIPTINLLQEASKIKRINKIVFLSSGGTVYGIPNKIPITETHQTVPICSYGIIKNTIEHYILLYQRLFGLNCIIFRLSNPYGERQNPNGNQGVIPVFLNKIILDKKIEIWGDGEVVRDYIYVKDITEVFVDSLKIQTPNSIYNIGSGVGLSLNQLILIMRQVTHKNINVEYKTGRSFDVPINVLDIDLAKKDFNWTPTTDIEEGVDSVFKYLQSTK